MGVFVAQSVAWEFSKPVIRFWALVRNSFVYHEFQLTKKWNFYTRIFCQNIYCVLPRSRDKEPKTKERGRRRRESVDRESKRGETGKYLEISRKLGSIQSSFLHSYHCNPILCLVSCMVEEHRMVKVFLKSYLYY